MNTTTLNMTTLDGGVIIKKGTAPAPPSGGEGSKMYYRIETPDTVGIFIMDFGTNMKIDTEDGKNVVGIAHIYALDIPSTNWKAVAIDVDTPTYSIAAGNRIVSLREVVEMEGFSVDDLSVLGLISITKEQFYSLD